MNQVYNAYIAIIGGRVLSTNTEKMARFIGNNLIESDCYLVTNGRSGVAQAAAQGAFEACEKRGVSAQERIFSYVPFGKQPEYKIGSIVNLSKNHLATNISLIKNSWGAIVVGGRKETNGMIRLAVLQAIVNGYCIIPASGTGGEADRICSCIPPFEDEILNDPLPSEEKAAKLIARVRQSPCWYCDIDIMTAHDEWFGKSTGQRTSIADEMLRIRHTYF